MSDLPTFRLREDAILWELERALKVDGLEVVVSAVAEFVLRHNRDPENVYQRVVAVVRGQAVAKRVRKRNKDRKAAAEDAALADTLPPPEAGPQEHAAP